MEISMKLVTYLDGKKERVGVINDDETWVYPLRSLGMSYESMQEVVEKMSKAEKELIGIYSRREPDEIHGSIPIKDVVLLAPIPRPRQDIICLGINYMEHAVESARYKKEAFGGERPYAVYFSKRVNEAVPNKGFIEAHEELVDSHDYECELAVIIGKDAKNVTEDEAAEYIFGYTIINDVSARNVQTRHKQWYFGKSLDGFTPMGPCITTADSIAYPPKLAIRSKVNGELRQNSNTELLIFDVAHVISELSSGMTLKAGTIISMGTPAGVGMGFEPPRFLKQGDTVECIVEGIGTLVNTVK